MRNPRRTRPLSELSRRHFLRGVGISGVGLAGGGLLAGCGTSGAEKTAQTCVSDDRSDQETEINFSNWPLYIDVSEDEQHRPTLEAFEKESGIKVNYTEDVNSNDEFFGKVRNQLAACQETGRDMFVVTDWVADRMIQLGWLQELNWDNLATVEKNMIDRLRKPPFDPDRLHSVPWQSGLTGLAYNAKLTDPVRSVDDLLTRPDLKGKVTLLNEMRDTMELLLLAVGSSPEDFTSDDFSLALERVQKAVDSGQVRAFTGNEYAQDLAQGNIVAAMCWSGDIIQLQFENPDIKFVPPEEGMLLWSDNMLVPNKATHKTNAEALMDYYYDPAVAAELAAWVNYISPVKGAREAMEEIDPELANNPLIFPDESFLSTAHSTMNVTEAEESKYNDLFQQVIGA